jgi:hypothetical protein
MNDIALEKRINQLARDLQLSGEAIDSKFLELRAEIDRTKLEIVALKKFLGAAIPSFSERFPDVLKQTIMEVDPESD